MKSLVLVLVACGNVALAQDAKDAKISMGIQFTSTAQAKKSIADDKEAQDKKYP